MTSTSITDDPVYKLLSELVEKDDERTALLIELKTELLHVKEDVSFVRGQLSRVDASLREVKTELGRQDTQIQALDRRITGNYTGIAGRLDIIDEDQKDVVTRLVNIERAVVTMRDTTQTLRGRMIEMSDLLGGTLRDHGKRMDVVEKDLAELDLRTATVENGVRAIEQHIARDEDPAVAASGS